MSIKEGLEDRFGDVDYNRFESELLRIRDEVNPPTEARDYAEAAAEKWGLPPAEQELIAIEQTFFVLRPQSEDMKRSYIHLFDDGGEGFYFGGGEMLDRNGWRGRIGVTSDTARKLAEGTFSPHAGDQIENFAHNFAQTFFNVKNEYELDRHGLSARHILYEPLEKDK